MGSNGNFMQCKLIAVKNTDSCFHGIFIVARSVLVNDFSVNLSQNLVAWNNKHYFKVSVGPESGSGLAVWFWLKVSDV